MEFRLLKRFTTTDYPDIAISVYFNSSPTRSRKYVISVKRVVTMSDGKKVETTSFDLRAIPELIRLLGAAEAYVREHDKFAPVTK